MKKLKSFLLSCFLFSTCFSLSYLNAMDNNPGNSFSERKMCPSKRPLNEKPLSWFQKIWNKIIPAKRRKIDDNQIDLTTNTEQPNNSTVENTLPPTSSSSSSTDLSSSNTSSSSSLLPSGIIDLASLQQNNYKEAETDCGYFAIYNAVQMIQANNESTLKQSLVNTSQFEDNYQIWKTILKEGTFLHTAEIEEILNKKDFALPSESICVLGDPNIFAGIQNSLSNGENPISFLEIYDFSQLKNAVEKFYQNGTPFAVIYRLQNMQHWITYGVRKENTQIKIYVTNSLKTTGIFTSQKEMEDAISLDIKSEEEKTHKTLSLQEKDEFKKTAENSFKEFEKQKQELHEQMQKNSLILLNLASFTSKSSTTNSSSTK